MRRNQWMSGLVIGLGLGMGASAAVAAPALPAAAKAHVADMRASCKDVGGRPGRSPELVQIADVTGDGRADYVINEGAFDCVGAESYFSGGSGGAAPGKGRQRMSVTEQVIRAAAQSFARSASTQIAREAGKILRNVLGGVSGKS